MIAECSSEELLAAYAAGACAAEDSSRIENHLRDCAACRAWLEEAGSNEAIAGSVVKAIDGYAGTGPPPLDAPEREADDAALIGQRVGGFLVERIIARGGMGTVYLAQQECPRREVALKVMRGGLLSRSARRRFEYESQMLARLRHPNIAQVYGAGVAEVSVQRSAFSDQPSGISIPHSTLPTPHSEVPYFAMEYVPNARTITEYASAHGLSIRQRLELFVQVCDAVHHGHQKGVIHRDLKPGNILVACGDEEGTKARSHEGTKGEEQGSFSLRASVPSSLRASPKVIDFGVACSIDADISATMHTHAGQLVGTLAYMSPEQCRADPNDIDIRSDVYSLGVVLYELLCERMPYEVSRTNIVAAGRTICEQPPDRPSVITRTLRGDIERIVLKALEKDRACRYASADALAQDVRRYLAGAPVEARIPTLWADIIRWSFRHPAGVTAGVCLGIVAVMIVGTLVAARLANHRPFRLTASSDYSAYKLLSFSGRELQSWPTGTEGKEAQSPLRRFVQQPADRGGRRLAVVSSPPEAVDVPGGSLCAYDVDRDLVKPVWCGAVAVEDLPVDADVEKAWGKRHLNHVDAFDIFPEVPGEEIVASYCVGPTSFRCIRIYDTVGTVLYQVWHDGAVGDLLWMSGPKLLIGLGDNKLVAWKEREGGQRVQNSEGAGPQVVFAIRPRLHFVSRGVLDSERPGEGDALSPVWYRCLLPPSEGTDRARVLCLNPAQRVALAGKRASVTIELLNDDGERGMIGFEIDEHGEEVPNTRYPTDSYRQLPSRPPLGMVFLGDLPPILSATSHPSN